MASGQVIAAAASTRTEESVRRERARYCEDCRFFQNVPSGKRFGTCSNPKAPKPDGSHFIAPELGRDQYASTMREIEAHCGPLGAWFEPKPSEAMAAE